MDFMNGFNFFFNFTSISFISSSVILSIKLLFEFSDLEILSLHPLINSLKFSYKNFTFIFTKLISIVHIINN